MYRQFLLCGSFSLALSILSKLSLLDVLIAGSKPATLHEYARFPVLPGIQFSEETSDLLIRSRSNGDDEADVYSAC